MVKAITSSGLNSKFTGKVKDPDSLQEHIANKLKYTPIVPKLSYKDALLAQASVKTRSFVEMLNERQEELEVAKALRSEQIQVEIRDIEERKKVRYTEKDNSNNENQRPILGKFTQMLSEQNSRNHSPFLGA